MVIFCKMSNFEEPKLQINFTVKSEDGREISFGGPVTCADLHEFFDRSFLGVKAIFSDYDQTNLIMVDVGSASKILAIKEIRNVTDMNLVEAKNFVERSTGPIKLKSVVAKTLGRKLTELGCVVRLGNNEIVVNEESNNA